MDSEFRNEKPRPQIGYEFFGILNTIKSDKWIVLPSKEVPINTNEVPEFLKNVFHGTWWEVDTSAYDILEDMIRN